MGRGNLALVVGFLVAVFSGDALHARQAEPEQVDQQIALNFIEKKVQPTYPEQARQMRIQGAVVLKVVINKKGKVSEVSTISGHPLLVPAAIDAVKQWKFKPYRVKGHKVEAWTDVVVKFELEK